MTFTSHRWLGRALRAMALGLMLAVGSNLAVAADAPSASANPELEARMMAMASELRCLVCQNQTIADSHSGLAEDLRQQIREMLAKGQSEREIMEFMTQRYGDFVLYRPPFKATTVLLWVGPAVLMVFAIGTLVVVLRRRQKLGDEAFDPDDADAASPAGPPAAR